MTTICPYCNRNVDLESNPMREVTAVADNTGKMVRINCPCCGKWFEYTIYRE